jgi:hypothetical protein
MARRHGFQWPPDTLQITAWLLILLFLAHFILMIVSVIPFPLSLILLLVYVGLTLMATVSGVVASWTDPADPFVKQCPSYASLKRSQTAPAPSSSSSSTNTHTNATSMNTASRGLDLSRIDSQQLLYCNLCASYVLKGSKHCRACNKCVAHFDHHCRWLNNCVAKKSNYRAFATFVVVLLLTTLLHLSMCIVLIVDYATGSIFNVTSSSSSSSSRSSSSSSSGSASYHSASSTESAVFPLDNSTTVQYVFLVSWCIFVFLSLLALYLLGDLLAFHIKLYRLGITTYEWILREREKDQRKLMQSHPQQQQQSQPPNSASSSASSAGGARSNVPSSQLPPSQQQQQRQQPSSKPLRKDIEMNALGSHTTSYTMDRRAAVLAGSASNASRASSSGSSSSSASYSSSYTSPQSQPATSTIGDASTYSHPRVQLRVDTTIVNPTSPDGLSTHGGRSDRGRDEEDPAAAGYSDPEDEPGRLTRLRAAAVTPSAIVEFSRRTSRANSDQDSLESAANQFGASAPPLSSNYLHPYTTSGAAAAAPTTTASTTGSLGNLPSESEGPAARRSLRMSNVELPPLKSRLPSNGSHLDV